MLRLSEPADLYNYGGSKIGSGQPAAQEREKLWQMAKCEQGYRCQVCGADVEGIAHSSLYLQFVIGWIEAEQLHTAPERHIRCEPTLSQFIVDDAFEPVVLEGDFDKRQLDPQFVAQREQLVTRGWRRLQELAEREEGFIPEYPLAEFRLHDSDKEPGD